MRTNSPVFVSVEARQLLFERKVNRLGFLFLVHLHPFNIEDPAGLTVEQLVEGVKGASKSNIRRTLKNLQELGVIKLSHVEKWISTTPAKEG